MEISRHSLPILEELDNTAIYWLFFKLNIKIGLAYIFSLGFMLLGY